MQSPSEQELSSYLGAAETVWARIMAAFEGRIGSVDLKWQPSKSDFGRICLVQHRKRTLVYLTPEKGAVKVAIVLGERSLGLAMASRIPVAIKKLFAEAKPYAEGRGIRFLVRSTREVPVITSLVESKMAPK